MYIVFTTTDTTPNTIVPTLTRPLLQLCFISHINRLIRRH